MFATTSRQSLRQVYDNICDIGTFRLRFVGCCIRYSSGNRGRRGEDIFLQPEDYELFLEIVRETKETWNLEVAAYCLMTNHYHLLVQTPDGNLSRCMRQINGVYTQRFNRAHKLDGDCFVGDLKRYWSKKTATCPK